MVPLILPFTLESPFYFTHVRIILFAFIVIVIAFNDAFSDEFLYSFFDVYAIALFHLMNKVP